jgi:ApaG protein
MKESAGSLDRRENLSTINKKSHIFTLVYKKVQELPGFTATVDDVVYLDSIEAPADRPYAFVYFITISNRSNVPITVKGRKWIIESKNKEKMIVEGTNVVDQTPRLAPGQEFSYNSFHVIAMDSTATGAFLAVTDEGVPVYARIPRFEMVVP